jgi:hypothetical protein
MLKPYHFFLTLLLLARSVAIVSAEVRGSESYRPMNSSTLWYLKPAENHGSKNAWMEYYLPLGNGHLGAMVGGGVPPTPTEGLLPYRGNVNMKDF